MSASHPFQRAFVAAVASVPLMVASAVSPPGTATAATSKFLEANCLATSMVGDGCAVWGTPHWVEVGRNATPIPQAVIDQAAACAVEGLIGLFEGWKDGKHPPQYRLLISGVYVFDGCVKGLTQANVKLTED